MLTTPLPDAGRAAPPRPELRPETSPGARPGRQSRAGGAWRPGAWPAGALRRAAAAVVLALPALLTALYVWGLATPQYAAEAAFMIRGREESAAPRAGLFGLGAGGSPAQMMDGFAVAEFAGSHDALRQLRAQLDWDAMMARAGGDPLMRYAVTPGGDADLAYFRSMVQADFSLTKQIVTLRVHAFAPADAAAIGAAMIAIVEDFANLMNERARTDMVRAAEREVQDAARDLQDRQALIQEWRLANNNIDPGLFTEMVSQSIARVEEALLEARIDLARLNALAEPGARGRDLQTRIDVLDRELARQQARLTGAGDDSAARQAVAYERLQLAREISKELYATAIEALSEARADANRQQKFIVVVKSPVADASADWPHGLRAVALAFVASVFAWLIGRFLYDAATEGFYG